MGRNVKPLDFLEQQFLLEWINNGRNVKRAAAAVGMDEQPGYELLRRTAFRSEVERLTGTALGLAEVSENRIIQELAAIAFLDPGELLNSDGSMKDLADLPDDVRRAVGGLDITTRDSDKYFTVDTKVKMLDKMRAMEMLGKHLRMFVDRVETEGKDDEARTKNIELEERIKLMEKDRASVVPED